MDSRKSLLGVMAARGRGLRTQENPRSLGTIPPEDALVFGFSAGLAWMMLGCSFLCFAFAIFVLVMQSTDPSHISPPITLLCFLLFGSFSVLTLRSSRRLRDSVAVNTEGIWYLPRKGEFTFIPWRDIGSVTAADVQQRLVLIDSTGSRSIKLEYQLQHFGRLREFVLSHAPAQTRLPAPIGTTFHRAMINKAVLLTAAATFIAAAYLSRHQGQPGASWCFVVFSALSLVPLVQDPLRLLVGRQGVVIIYPGWKQTIPFDGIENISLRDESLRGNVWAAVVIQRRQGRPVKLYRFREGSLALYDTLQPAWRGAASEGTSSLKE